MQIAPFNRLSLNIWTIESVTRIRRQFSTTRTATKYINNAWKQQCIHFSMRYHSHWNVSTYFNDFSWLQMLVNSWVRIIFAQYIYIKNLLDALFIGMGSPKSVELKKTWLKSVLNELQAFIKCTFFRRFRNIIPSLRHHHHCPRFSIQYSICNQMLFV